MHVLWLARSGLAEITTTGLGFTISGSLNPKKSHRIILPGYGRNFKDIHASHNLHQRYRMSLMLKQALRTQ